MDSTPSPLPHSGADKIECDDRNADIFPRFQVGVIIRDLRSGRQDSERYEQSVHGRTRHIRGPDAARASINAARQEEIFARVTSGNQSDACRSWLDSGLQSAAR